MYRCFHCGRFLEWVDGQWVCPNGCITTIYQSTDTELNRDNQMTLEQLIEIIKSVKTINGQLCDFDCIKIATAIKEEEEK